MNCSLPVLCLQKHKPALSNDELTTTRKNLEARGVDVENEFVSAI